MGNYHVELIRLIVCTGKKFKGGKQYYNALPVEIKLLTGSKFKNIKNTFWGESAPVHAGVISLISPQMIVPDHSVLHTLLPIQVLICLLFCNFHLVQTIWGPREKL